MINFFVVALLAVWKPVESLEQRPSHPLETTGLWMDEEEWRRVLRVYHRILEEGNVSNEINENRRDTMCCCESSALFWEIYDRIKVN